MILYLFISYLTDPMKLTAITGDKREPIEIPEVCWKIFSAVENT